MLAPNPVACRAMGTGPALRSILIVAQAATLAISLPAQVPPRAATEPALADGLSTEHGGFMLSLIHI